MDVNKQVEYWKKGAEEDIAAAQSLLEKGHLRHCLFFAHLALEKALKAHVVRSTGGMPPRIHNLLRLSEIGEISLGKEKKKFLRRFDVHQLEGRYPDTQYVPLTPAITRDELLAAKETIEWLTAQL